MSSERRMRVAILAIAALSAALATPPAAAGVESTVVARDPVCAVSVARLGDLWSGAETWGSAMQDTGDAVVDAMRQTLGSSDPSDLEVLEMQKSVAETYLEGVREYRAKHMKDDLREITGLGGEIRGSVSAQHRSYVRDRIAKIRSLYREYWYDLFAPAYIRGLQELTDANIAGWTASTAPLPAKVPMAHHAFEGAFRGLSKVC
jgi:hypothetical protein